MEITIRACLVGVDVLLVFCAELFVADHRTTVYFGSPLCCSPSLDGPVPVVEVVSDGVVRNTGRREPPGIDAMQVGPGAVKVPDLRVRVGVVGAAHVASRVTRATDAQRVDRIGAVALRGFGDACRRGSGTASDCEHPISTRSASALSP